MILLSVRPGSSRKIGCREWVFDALSGKLGGFWQSSLDRVLCVFLRGGGRYPLRVEFRHKEANVDPLRVEGHIGLVVDSFDEFEGLVKPLVDQGVRSGDKVIVLGADRQVAAANDQSPYTGIVAGLTREVDSARRQGYRGVRVVANMDAFGTAPLSAGDLLAFELSLDRTVAGLGATMVCAYHSGRFRPDAVAAAMSAHPYGLGLNCTDLGFRLWSSTDGRWNVGGEVDLVNAPTFRWALISAADTAEMLRLSFDDLRFVDLAGVQALADVVDAVPGLSLRVESSPTAFRRCWRMLGHDTTCSRVEILG